MSVCACALSTTRQASREPDSLIISSLSLYCIENTMKGHWKLSSGAGTHQGVLAEMEGGLAAGQQFDYEVNLGAIGWGAESG